MKMEEILIKWYNQNKRALPWRETTDPYKIWVSEVILQQTRVNQGISYYYRFLEKFPNVKTLADADEKEVLLVWQGLGYYSRARNMHAAAKYVVEVEGGVFPKDYDGLIKLKGIGSYTAAAIASFSYKQKVAAVDGNVMRVIARLFRVEDPVNSTKGSKRIEAIANTLISEQHPDIFNQAIMEFGALCCLPKNPNCVACPLIMHCEAYKNQLIEQLPVKKKSKPARNRYLNYLVITDSEKLQLVLSKRNEKKDIWYNLYQFPVIESDTEWEAHSLVESAQFKSIIKENEFSLQGDVLKKKHLLSHQTLYISFWKVGVNKITALEKKNDLEVIDMHSVSSYPLPQVVAGYVEEQIISMNRISN